MTPIALALAFGQLDPAKEVFIRSISSMDERKVFATTYRLETLQKGKTKKSAYFVQGRRPTQSYIASLDGQGQRLNSVAINLSGRIVTKMEVRQHVNMPAVKWDEASAQLMSQVPGLDAFVVAGCAPEGWASYVSETLAKGKGWKARFGDGVWTLLLQAPAGQLTLKCRAGDFLPVELRMAGEDNLAVWRLDHKASVDDSLFGEPKATRLVQRFHNFPPPRSLDPLSKPLVERLFKSFDVVRTLAIETEAGGTTTRLYARGNRIRQTGGGVDWSYDGKNLRIKAGGKISNHKADGSQMQELVAVAGGRLDPLWTDLLMGANPIRRLLSAADVRHKGSISTPQGSVALLQVTAELEKLTLAIRESDGKLVSLSRIPRSDRNPGLAVSSTKNFHYLDEAILAKDSAFRIGEGGA
jgi:hypothetical protein